MAVNVRDGNARPIGEVVRDLAEGTQTLIMQEVQLAKLELKASAQGAAAPPSCSGARPRLAWSGS